MGNHLKGLVFTSLGVLLVVPDSLFVRLIEAEPMVTAFWRGLTAGVFVLLALLSIRGLQDFRAVFRTGWPGLIYTVLIATTAPAFVLAVANAPAKLRLSNIWKLTAQCRQRGQKT